MNIFDSLTDLFGLSESDYNQKKWDIRYMNLAKTVASWSKDPSSKLGAVAVSKNGIVLSQGYNGLPRKIKDTHFRLYDKPTKYSMVVHAEMNMIFNAGFNGVKLDNSTIYVYGLPVCNECAKGIIQSGITRVVIHSIKNDAKWDDLFKLTKEMFIEANIDFEFISNLDEEILTLQYQSSILYQMKSIFKRNII